MSFNISIINGFSGFVLLDKCFHFSPPLLIHKKEKRISGRASKKVVMVDSLNQRVRVYERCEIIPELVMPIALA